MTRFAFVTTMEGTPWGGSEELWSGAALRLAQEGHQVGSNVPRWSTTPNRLGQLTRAGCTVVRRRRSDTLLGKALRLAHLERPQRWLLGYRPELVVISQGANADGLSWMSYCAEHRLPFATIAQAANDDFWPPWETVLELRKGYLDARTAYFVSRANLELTEQQIGHRLPNAAVVRNPFNVSYDAQPAWPGDDAPFRLACVGRLALGAKGQDLLLRVLAQPKWRERPVELSLIGDGPNRETLVALRDMLGLTSVRLVAPTDDIESVWAQHHALVLASRYEGLPLVIIEAMLCGRICIVTDVAGNAELIEHGTHGFVAAAPAFRCVDQAMEEAWTARAAWKAMGQDAAMHVRRNVPRDPAVEFARLVHGLCAQSGRVDSPAKSGTLENCDGASQNKGGTACRSRS